MKMIYEVIHIGLWDRFVNICQVVNWVEKNVVNCFQFGTGTKCPEQSGDENEQFW